MPHGWHNRLHAVSVFPGIYPGGHRIMKIAFSAAALVTAIAVAGSLPDTAHAGEDFDLQLTDTQETLSFELPDNWEMVGHLTDSPAGPIDIRLYRQGDIPDEAQLESFSTEFNPRLRATGQEAINGMGRAAANVMALRLKDCSTPAPTKPFLQPLNGYPSVFAIAACPVTAEDPPHSTMVISRYVQSPHGLYTLTWSSARPLGADGKPTREPPQGFDYAIRFFENKVRLCEPGNEGNHPCTD